MSVHEGKPCIFSCGRLSTKSGEHVIPQWLLKDMNVWGRNPNGPANQFGVKVNGEDVLNEDGTVFKSRKPIEYTAPCCRPCNTRLSRGFEQRKEAILAFLDGEPAEDARFVGRWLLKSTLLFLHPLTVDSSPRSQLPHDFVPPDVDLYSWMVQKKPVPPDFLSLWAAIPTSEWQRTDPYIPDGTQHLPAWSWGSTGPIRTGTGLIGIRNVSFRVAFHPGFEVHDPVESCIRVWPDPNGTPLPMTSEGDQATWHFPFACNHAEVRLGPDTESPFEVPLRVRRNTEAGFGDVRIISSCAARLDADD